MNAPTVVDRRQLLAGSGALIVSFSLAPAFAQDQAAPAAAPAPKPPGSLEKSPYLDSWIRIDAEGITAFTGKAELGQGFKTAFQQIAAEQLEVPFASVKVITADTKLTANEGYTAGSHSMQDSGTAILHAAAQARELLVAEAAKRFDAPADSLRTENGTVIASDGRRLGYGELVASSMLHVEAQPVSKLKDPATFKVMGQPIPRVDIPAKVTGGVAYVQDLRLPGMVHARVVRPPSYGAQLVACDTAAIEKLPGVVKVVRDGNFLAVVAKKEFQAVKAMQALSAATQWKETAQLPKQEDLLSLLTTKLPSKDFAIFQRGNTSATGQKTIEATYTRPYQSHGSIGPSCAVAQLADDGMTVWSHTQGVYPDRQAIAEMLHMAPQSVRLIHVEGSGCYGHNGADDAAADAALIARALPGQRVRVQWMREQEHAWEPYGPAMVTKLKASIGSDGKIADWNFAVFSNTHSMRPGGAGCLLAAQHMAQPFAVPPAKPLPLPEGGGDRNAIPIYSFPNAHVTHHFLPDMPIRISAMRALGAYHNVFSIESFMDELAALAGTDPVEFRLKHLDDPRGRDVIEKAAQEFGWHTAQQAPPDRGYGFAFARYKNLAAYCAIATEVEVNRETGRARLVRAVAAVDSGQVVNPDGLTNQVEGAIVQSMSWTLYERVTFDESRITSIDWQTYPILRFDAVPEKIDVHIINRPGQPFLGSGETGQGPAAASLANAIANATGKRLRDLPLTRKRIKDAIDA